MFSFEEDYREGEDDKLLEYEAIREKINEKYNTDSTNKEIRNEFLETINKLFSKMSEEHSDDLFGVVQIMIEEFKINEGKFVRYLNKENEMKLRNFAKNNFETTYYETMEKRKKDAKLIKKGKSSEIRESISDLFE